MESKSIGSFIAVLRKAKGMTQQDLALKLNVSNKTVSKWECNETYPDISLIPIIAEVLEVTCDEILKGERIFYEDKSEKTDKKISKQVRHLIDKAIARFKLYSLINIMLIIIGVLVNYIVSYSAYRPDIGFGVMVCVFAISITLEIISLINLNSKFNDKEMFESSGVDFESSVNLTKYKYSFIVFYLSFFFIFVTLPLILTRILVQGDELPIKNVLLLSEYIKLLPYFLIIPIIGLSPTQSLYKNIIIKNVPKTDKKIIIFGFIQLILCIYSFAVVYNVFFIVGYPTSAILLGEINTANTVINTTGIISDILPVLLITASIIVIGTVFLFYINNEKDKKINILITSIRNLIFLFCPLIDAARLSFYFTAGLSIFLKYSLIIVITAAYAFIVRRNLEKH